MQVESWNYDKEAYELLLDDVKSERSGRKIIGDQGPGRYRIIKQFAELEREAVPTETVITKEVSDGKADGSREE